MSWGRLGPTNISHARELNVTAHYTSPAHNPELRGAKVMIATAKVVPIKMDSKAAAFAAHLSHDELRAAGKALREKCPRASHAAWKPPHDRPDPVRVVLKTDEGRLPDLLPLRHGRMMLSPFTFYRGSAFAMAQDLASTPSTGIRVQCGGDSHLVNFRCLGTPERNVIFAINDLDETLPAPWEWDLKRLAASIVVACRDNGLSESVAEDAVLTCVRSYREHMAEFSEMKVLDLWYFAIDANMLISDIKDPALRGRAIRRLAKARESSTSEGLFPKLVDDADGLTHFKDQLPAIFHAEGHTAGAIHRDVKEAFDQYRETMLPSHRMLLDHYETVDAAIKVVGVGSVGTACFVILLMARGKDPLILQIKEARGSVLESFAGKSVYPNHGQRVVTGIRLMQPSSDIFLGWTEGRRGRHFYVRQLRDVKIKFAVETFGKTEMDLFVDWCGQSLALSHARSGEPAVISGYLGKSDTFDKAIAAFSRDYADQNESDHAALKRAIKNGKLKADFEEER